MSPEFYKVIVYIFIIGGGVGWMWQKGEESRGNYGCGGTLLMLGVAALAAWATWQFFIVGGHHGLQ